LNPSHAGGVITLQRHYQGEVGNISLTTSEPDFEFDVYANANSFPAPVAALFEWAAFVKAEKALATQYGFICDTRRCTWMLD
ncbi:hypothetical protein O5559_28445, partial [Escherichia coli]|nr:hypothetical protein [Escherichia coli]